MQIRTELLTAGELVDAIHEAAFTADAWPALLSRIAEELDADGTYCCVLVRNPTRVVFGAVGRIDPGAHAEYVERYFPFDLRIPRILAHATPAVWHERELVSDSERRRSALHNEFLAKYDCEHVLLARSDIDDDTHLVVAAGRSRRRADFDSDSRRLLGGMLPDLRRSLRVRLRLRVLEQQHADLDAIVNLADFGVFLLDHDARIVYANRSGQALLQESTCVRSIGGRLVPAGARTSAPAFRTMMEAAIRGGEGSLDHARHAMLLPRAHGGAPVAVRAVPLQHTPYRELELSARVVVFLVDTGRGRPSRKHLLRGLFHLSPMEARVVDLLCDGASLEKVAELLDVTKNTVKTHLRGAFRKTNTRRQSELVAVLGRDLLALESLLQR